MHTRSVTDDHRVTRSRWHVRFTATELPQSRSLPSTDDNLHAEAWREWLRRTRQTPGTPFLLSPSFDYDPDLNDFFRSAAMSTMASTTQVGYARDIASFFTFVNHVNTQRLWRDVSEDDHLTYLHWRRHDPEGPRVGGNTWNREVAAVNRFYKWAHTAGHVSTNPVPQTWRRPAPAHTGYGANRRSDELRPATYAHDGGRDRIQWLPLADYRRWREVGVRGFDNAGLPREGFRGRWSGRNAVFCDLMVRTGLRISEQSALTTVELPHIDTSIVGYQRFWLPPSIAKGWSGRWVYVPSSLVRDLAAYCAFDRDDVIRRAREHRRYERLRRPFVIENPERPVATRVTGSALKQIVKVSELTWADRQQLLISRAGGLEPAAFWLGEHGMPLSVAAWKKMFADANTRCHRTGVPLSVHAHMLRHTFAVVTLEQLQRGHIAALGSLSPSQRGQYTRIFGDPLDWVRRRLGHRSVVTTQIYLHALAELEMDTRIALVPDDWEPPALDAPASDGTTTPSTPVAL